MNYSHTHIAILRTKLCDNEGAEDLANAIGTQHGLWIFQPFPFLP